MNDDKRLGYEGDTGPALEATLTVGDSHDLEGATVRFQLARRRPWGIVVDSEATIVDETAGEVLWAWDDETPIPPAGAYRYRWLVQLSDGEEISVPVTWVDAVVERS